MLHSKLRIAKYLIFIHTNLVDMIISSLKCFQQTWKTFKVEYRIETWSLILCKIMSISYNGIYNSSQGVREPTEKHLKPIPSDRIMSQEIRSLKFSLKCLLNRCILCPHKTGYIDVLNQNLLLINLTNDFMGYGTDIFK